MSRIETFVLAIDASTVRPFAAAAVQRARSPVPALPALVCLLGLYLGSSSALQRLLAATGRAPTARGVYRGDLRTRENKSQASHHRTLVCSENQNATTCIIEPEP